MDVTESHAGCRAGKGGRGSYVCWASGRSERASSAHLQAAKGGRASPGPPSGWGGRATPWAAGRRGEAAAVGRLYTE